MPNYQRASVNSPSHWHPGESGTAPQIGPRCESPRALPGEDPNSLPPPARVADLFLDLASPECALNGEIVHPSQ